MLVSFNLEQEGRFFRLIGAVARGILPGKSKCPRRENRRGHQTGVYGLEEELSSLEELSSELLELSWEELELSSLPSI